MDIVLGQQQEARQQGSLQGAYLPGTCGSHSAPTDRVGFSVCWFVFVFVWVIEPNDARP